MLLPCVNRQSDSVGIMSIPFVGRKQAMFPPTNRVCVMVGHITYVKSSPRVELHTFLLKVRCRRKYHIVWEIIPFDGGKIDKAMRNTLFVLIKKTLILKSTSLIIPDIIMVTAKWQISISWHPLMYSNPKIDRQFESLKIIKWSTTSWNNVSIFSGDPNMPTGQDSST